MAKKTKFRKIKALFSKRIKAEKGSIWDILNEKARWIKQHGCDSTIQKWFDRGEDISEQMEKEAKRKYDKIVKNIESKVGDVIEVALYTKFGDINGIITGTKAKIKVNTIEAGGYNIQRYHFRFLIKEIK